METLSQAAHTLYSLTDEITAIFDRVTDFNGEITKEDEAALLKAQELIATKIDSCSGYRENLLELVDRAEKRISELKILTETVTRKVEKFDDYVASCVKKMPNQEIKGDLVSVKLRKPSKKVEVFDEALLPIEFIKIPEPKAMVMKSEIAEALKSGLEVPGARLIDGKESVAYKVRSV